MSDRGLPLPPSVEELAELSRQLAVTDPGLLPAFVWCLCRSSRAIKAFRASRRPSSAHLAMLRSYPVAKQLITSSRAGVEWLRKWSETREALDDLLPPTPGDGGSRS